MAYQLVYTSYPISLVQGRTGFSTVARTAGMSEKLASAVERCSIFDASKGVVYTHRILSVGAETWHVLSRICDAGVDYTNRNNYLAHHLIISSNEAQYLANPAEILLQWNGWLSSWDEQPKYIPEVEDLKNIQTLASVPCKKWGNLFGDSATAALLGSSTATILADITCAKTLLELYSESLLLNINPAGAWDYTFTTHSFDADNPATFLWKATTNAQNPTVDLVNRKTSSIPNDRAAEYARTGEMTNREKFGLKVGAPKQYKQNFNVVDTTKSKGKNLSPTLLIGGAIIVSAILVAIIFIVSFSNDSEPVDTSKRPIPTLKSIEKSESQKRTFSTLSDLKDAIKLEIERCEFQQAINLWNDSSFAEKDPSYESKILSDIGYKADSLMRYSENIFDSETATETENATAITNVFAARRALDIEGVPRRQVRLDRWNILNSKIKK